MTATIVPSKGRVTVPQQAQGFLGIGPGSRITFDMTPAGDVALLGPT
jgi:bifunctional DNA-binding transcriptional regulator/antitoxin component of YhaV-PrlF toxin-antitoxin module